LISEADLFKIYQALGNPHRRGIIMLLGENPEGLTFSELRRRLNLSVGTIYYNLDQLEDLVCQKSDRRYALTEKGLLAYEMLKSNIEMIKNKAGGSISTASRLQALLFPRWFFMLLESRGKLMPLLALAVLLAGSLSCWYNGVLLGVTWVGSTSVTFLSSSSFIWSWLAVALTSFMLASAGAKEKLRRLPRYLAEAGFSMFPIAIFVAIEPLLRVAVVARAAAQVVLWLLAIMLTSSALSRSAQCRIEVALLITILVMFVASIAIPQLVAALP
jgi:DNA-binding transcriptional ArsR family regulator